MAYLQALPDPFGSYVRGEQAGQESTIREGQAARAFRAADLSPEVQKWYLPLVQREAQTRAATGELGLNEGLLRNAAQVSAFGPGGTDYLGNTVKNIYGFEPDFNGTDPRTAYLRANLGAGNIQPTYADPSVGWGTQGGGFARPSAAPQAGPEDELTRLQREYETETMRRRLDSLRNPSQGGIFGSAFSFLSPNGTGAANQNASTPGGVTPSQPKQPTQQQQQGNPDHYGSGGIFVP